MPFAQMVENKCPEGTSRLLLGTKFDLVSDRMAIETNLKYKLTSFYESIKMF